MSFSDWSSDLCSSDLYCSHAHFNAAIRRRIKAGGCGRENNSAAVDDFDIPVALAAHARTLRQRADTLHRRINLAPVPDHERELVVTAGNITDGNLGIAPSEFGRSEEHTSASQSLMRNSVAGFSLKQKK